MIVVEKAGMWKLKTTIDTNVFFFFNFDRVVGSSYLLLCMRWDCWFVLDVTEMELDCSGDQILFITKTEIENIERTICNEPVCGCCAKPTEYLKTFFPVT